MTPTKMVFGFAAIASLLMVFALQRLPGEPPAKAETKAETIVAKTDDKIRNIDLSKDTMASADLSKPVVTERIVPDAPAKMPPIVRVDDDDRPAARRRRTAESDDGPNVCTRHGMKKVYTNGGRSWRCRK